MLTYGRLGRSGQRRSRGAENQKSDKCELCHMTPNNTAITYTLTHHHYFASPWIFSSKTTISSRTTTMPTKTVKYFVVIIWNIKDQMFQTPIVPKHINKRMVQYTYCSHFTQLYAVKYNTLLQARLL